MKLIPRQDTAMPVRDYMRADVHSVRDSERLQQADAQMSELGVSALPVLDGTTRLAGVITRADLLRAGRIQIDEGRNERLLRLPSARVREHMHTTVQIVAPDVPLLQAAQRMVQQRLHRLFVVQDGRLLGVLGTREMMAVVAENRLEVPLEALMTRELVSVKSDEPVVLAVDRMATTEHATLVVLEGRWPVGVFSQVEALAARDASPQRTVEQWMDPSILCLPAGIPAHRAASQALATSARCVLAVGETEVQGIVTGTDFTRLIAESESR